MPFCCSEGPMTDDFFPMSGFSRAMRAFVSTMRGLIASIRETIKNYHDAGFAVVPKFILSFKKAAEDAISAACYLPILLMIKIVLFFLLWDFRKFLLTSLAQLLLRYP